MPTRILAESISERVFLLRGKRILLDSALAELYGVTTKRLNEQVRRNRARFPEDFLLELTRDEVANLKSHFATSRWGGRRSRPLAFTEHGEIMVATILSSPRAVQMTVYVVRAFIPIDQLVRIPAIRGPFCAPPPDWMVGRVGADR